MTKTSSVPVPFPNNDTFTYDLASRMLTAVSARYANTVTRTYDAAGRTTADNLTIGGNTYNVAFGFDAADRLTGITYPDGSAVSRSYWPRNLLKEVDYTPNGGAAALVAKRNYDNGERLITTTLGNSLVETRHYRNDPGGLIDNMISSISVPGVTGFTYVYDANKNKTAENDSVIGNYSWSTGATGYDAKDRLTNWTRTNGDSQNWNLSLVGDWSSTTVNGTVDTRTHSAVHELLTRSTSPTALVYDAKGNLTTNSNNQTYDWDYDNQMGQAVNGGTTGNYAYDALGRRVSKTIGTTTTVFVSALHQEIAEYANGTLTTKYVFGDYVDEPLMLVSVAGGTETTYYYHSNAMYCVAALTSSTGNVVERYEYSPYGKVTISTNAGPDGIWFTADDTYASSSAIGNPFVYTGRRLDAETGLYYYRARYYDADAGRFLGRDLAEYNSGMNLYDYVDSDPTNGIDPLGLWKQIGSKTKDDRATWSSQENDNLAGLAKKVGLSGDVNEVNYWLQEECMGMGLNLKTRKGRPIPVMALAQEISRRPDLQAKLTPCQEFTVPNVWISADLMHGGGLPLDVGCTVAQFVGTDIFTHKKVVKPNNFSDLQKDITANRGNIWGIVILSHGSKDGYIGVDFTYPTEFTKWGPVRSVISGLSDQHFKVAQAYGMYCYSAYKGPVTYSEVKDANGKVITPAYTVNFDWVPEWLAVSLHFHGFTGLDVAGIPMKNYPK